MRVVCISDTHGLHAALQDASPIPPGDVLVHAGDFTDTGARDEVLAFNAWLATLPHRYKIVIAGNHESTFDRAFYPHNWHHYGHAQRFDPIEVRALLTNALYLEDQAVLIDGFLFYGTPWQPEFCNWAFNLPRGDKLVEKWRLIPSDVDVLVTHSPPMGRGDQVGHLRVGCSDLLREVQTRIKPPYHVFGHVHEGYGRSSDGVTTFMNASSCTHEYEAVNAPMIIDLRRPRTVHDLTLDTNQAIRYDVLLHEQLRVCSQKPAFVPLPGTDSLTGSATNGTKREHPHGPCHSLADAEARRQSLKEFSVDGTTAAMLFESTLKLRPVKVKQTRALRYLFHHGFTAADGDVSAIDDGQLGEEGGSMDETAGVADEPERSTPMDPQERLRERRRVSLSRRVTMAVLEELPDAKRDAIAPGAASLFTVSSADAVSTTATREAAVSPAAAPPAGNQRRARRDKTLQRREAVPKLATMVEEPEKEAAAAAESQATVTATVSLSVAAKDATVGGTSPSASTSSQPEAATPTLPAAPVPAPDAVSVTSTPDAPVQASASAPAKECIMCKYKVNGHVHPPSDATAQPMPGAPAPPATTAVAPPTTAIVAAARSTLPPPSPLSAAPAVTADPPVAPPAVECVLCKYKVAGHVHPGAEPAVVESTEDDSDYQDMAVDDAASVPTGRARAVGPKRLSSWF